MANWMIGGTTRIADIRGADSDETFSRGVGPTHA